MHMQLHNGYDMHVNLQNWDVRNLLARMLLVESVDKLPQGFEMLQ